MSPSGIVQLISVSMVMVTHPFLVPFWFIGEELNLANLNAVVATCFCVENLVRHLCNIAI